MSCGLIVEHRGIVEEIAICTEHAVFYGRLLGKNTVVNKFGYTSIFKHFSQNGRIVLVSNLKQEIVKELRNWLKKTEIDGLRCKKAPYNFALKDTLMVTSGEYFTAPYNRSLARVEPLMRAFNLPILPGVNYVLLAKTLEELRSD